MSVRLRLGLFGAVFSGGCIGGGQVDQARLSVYAASSLSDAFGELESLFEDAHGGADVVITYAGSHVLRRQIEEGAPADVFASADPRHMEALVDGGRVSTGSVFAHNELVVVVPRDNPARIESFADLPRATRLVLGTTGAPVGRYARRMLSVADSLVSGFGPAVLDGLVSEEPNARLTRSKVELGDADAAIVYRTDAASSDRVRSISIPAPVNVRAEYSIGVVARTGRPALADAWIGAVLSPEGQALLVRHGFGAR